MEKFLHQHKIAGRVVLVDVLTSERTCLAESGQTLQGESLE